MRVVSIMHNFEKISSINFKKISKELILGLQITHLPHFDHNMNFHWNLIQNSVASSITKLFPMIFHDLKTFLVFSITFKFKILIFLMTKAKQIRRFWHIIWTRISSFLSNSCNTISNKEKLNSIFLGHCLAFEYCRLLNLQKWNMVLTLTVEFTKTEPHNWNYMNQNND